MRSRIFALMFCLLLSGTALNSASAGEMSRIGIIPKEGVSHDDFARIAQMLRSLQNSSRAGESTKLSALTRPGECDLGKVICQKQEKELRERLAEHSAFATALASGAAF